MLSKKGFSLIEVLVTIGIIAGLAAISVPVYTEHKAKSKRAECTTHMVSIMKSAIIFMDKTDLAPCRMGTNANLKDKVCGTAGHRQIEFPLKGTLATDISKFYYTYSVRPAGTTHSNVTNLYWFPTPGVGAYGENINMGGVESTKKDLSATADIVVACNGRIISGAANEDELYLTESGQLMVCSDMILGATPCSGVGNNGTPLY